MRKYSSKRHVFADTDIAPEADGLLFETEDVADLISEVTGEEVEVVADDTEVTFTVGEDDYVVTAEPDSEVVSEDDGMDDIADMDAVSESRHGKACCSRSMRGRRVSASRRTARRRVNASRTPKHVVRKHR